MGRPTDPTKLSEHDAGVLRDFLQRGKEQYGLTWRDVGDKASYDEKAVRNYVNGSRPPSARVAKTLLRGVLEADSARAWRQRNGCPKHRTGEPVLCDRLGENGEPAPCDQWYVDVWKWAMSRPWMLLQRPPIPVLIDTYAFDELSERLAESICRASGIGQGKRTIVAKAIRSFLGRHGERFADDGADVFGFRIAELIKASEHGEELPKRLGFDDPLFETVPHADLARFQKRALAALSRLYWPNLIKIAAEAKDQTKVLNWIDPDSRFRRSLTRTEDDYL